MVDWSSVSAVTGVAGLILTTAGYALNRRNSNEQEWRRADDTFRRARQRLKMDMSELQVLAQDAMRKHLLVPNVPLLVRQGWVPDRPLELNRVVLHWQRSAEVEEKSRREFDPARDQTRHYWSRSRDLRDTYHEVIRRIESPKRELFFDGSAFRLLGVTPPGGAHAPEMVSQQASASRESSDEFVLHFGSGRY